MRQKIKNQRFGRLIAIEEMSREGSRKHYWRCRCDCGNEVIVEESHLKDGHTKSCGCYRREKRRRDLTGERFGRLTVLRRIDGKEGKSKRWECRCDCGNICICMQANLLSGTTRSCGCLREEQRKVNMKKAIHFVDGTCVERIASRKIYSNNKTGCRGVYRRENNTWRASIGFQGKLYSLGSFYSFEEAVRARREAEERLYEPFLKEYDSKKVIEAGGENV